MTGLQNAGSKLHVKSAACRKSSILLVRLDTENSNQLFDVLADWSVAFKDCEPMLTAVTPPAYSEI
jgi:hypothetical protein